MAQSINADQQRTVNFYQETADSPVAVTRKQLYPTPGVTALALTLPTIPTPAAPTVVTVGAAGATQYNYVVVAFFAAGPWHTASSNVTTITTGNATLDGTNFNRITWVAPTNAVRYSVYRIAPGVDIRIAETITALTLDDTGIVGVTEESFGAGTTGTAITPSGNGRAHAFINEREFAVIGTILFEIASNELITPRGTVATDANPATISTNGDGGVSGGELFITSGGNGYRYILSSNAFSTISALAGLATMGDMIDGYFLSFDAETSTWYISDLLTAATWDPTNFVQRSSQGDAWVALKVNSPYIYLYGEITSETWYNAGSFPIPFAKHSSGGMPYGCVAPFSPEIVGGSIVWLGRTANGQGIVLRTSGFAPEVISTYAEQVALAGYSSLGDAVGDTYEDLGHTFYVLTFGAGNATRCWDEKERQWHERGTWVAGSVRFDAWRPLFHAFAFGKHRMLDRSTGNVYRMSSDIGTDVLDDAGAARPLRRMRSAPAMVSENRMVYYPGIEIALDPGVGLSGAGQGSDPEVMLRMSDDGGHTWGNEIKRSAGKIGAYGTRVQFFRCGAARQRVFEISVSDPVPWRILGAYLPDLERANPGLIRQRGAA